MAIVAALAPWARVAPAQEGYGPGPASYAAAEAAAWENYPQSFQPPAPAGIADTSHAVGSDLNLRAKWNHGLELTTPAGDFRIHIGGRTQFDTVWMDAGDNVEFGPGGTGDLGDSFNFRRARLRIDGEMYEVIEWAAEYDFVNQTNVNPGTPATNANSANVPALTDLWLTIKELPVVGNFRIGNMKEPIGMEHLTSSRFLPFMERSLLQDAFFGPFNNGFSPGMMIFNWGEEERSTWALGLFKNTSNIFGNGFGDGEYAVTGRATCLPIYDESSDGRLLMHLGVSGSHRDLDADVARVRARPSLRLGNPGPFNPIVADTGNFFGDDQDLLGGEFAMVVGSLTLQSEYTASWIQDATVGGVDQGAVLSQGWYAQALYFLTGERDKYNRRGGAFERVVPFENFFLVRSCEGLARGHGAWQVGARYGFLDLRDSGIDGGVVQDVTLGLNWFLNPNAKFQWNYVWTDRDAAGTAADGIIHGVGMRMAYDF